MHRLTASHSTLRAAKPRGLDSAALTTSLRQNSTRPALAENDSRPRRLSERPRPLRREEHSRELRGEYLPYQEGSSLPRKGGYSRSRQEGYSRPLQEGCSRPPRDRYSQDSRELSRIPRELVDPRKPKGADERSRSSYSDSSRTYDRNSDRSHDSNGLRQYGRPSGHHEERPRMRDSPRLPRMVDRVEQWMIEKSARTIVSKSLLPHTSSWKQRPSLRGEEMQLKSKLKHASSQTRADSLDKVAFLADSGLEDDSNSTSVHLEPGAFVEARRNNIASHGMVLGKIFDGAWKIRLLIDSGEIWEPLPADIVFSIPSFASADLAARCGTGLVARSESELTARVEALRRTREIVKAVEENASKYSQSDIDVYAMVKSPDKNKWGTTTVTEVAHMFEPNPKVVDMFAAHTFLMQQPVYFLMDAAYQINQQFRVRPQSEVELLEKVTRWMRMRVDGPIFRFGEKAKKIIAEGRRVQLESAKELPSQMDAEHKWDPDDIELLNFLLHACRAARTTQSDPYVVTRSAVVRAIYPDGLEVTDVMVHKILMDLGVLAPWQDLGLLRPELDLDPQPEHASERVKSANELVQRSWRPREGPPVGPEDFHLTDPLESVRHDFGDMAVYVIDDVGAEELDDGISVERIPLEPGNLWTHVHVADAASLIPPSHALAQSAQRQGQTAYYLHGSFPLFPKATMNHPEHGLSLGSKKDGRPDRVLTFSVKTDPEGNILDFQVRAGLINNICVITYDSVDMALQDTLVKGSFPFGGEPRVPEAIKFAESQLQDLRDLREAAHRQVRKRVRSNLYTPLGHTVRFPKVNIDQAMESPTMKPVHFRGFPPFTYTAYNMADLDTGARATVAEMMKLACRVASLWSQDRKIPMVRRVAVPWTHTSDAHLQKILDMRSPLGHVNILDIMPYLAEMSPADYTIEPKGHWLLGIPDGEGYSRVTSPLRRFSDLVGHWQIHHALLGPNAPTNSPPFDTSSLAAYALTLKPQDLQWKRAEEGNTRFWSLSYIQRLMMNGDEPAHVLQNLEARIISETKMNSVTNEINAEVAIPALGVKASLTDVDQDVVVGERRRVKVKEIILGNRPKMQVVRC